jgi:multiple sugar transport system substrate-binding protein
MEAVTYQDEVSGVPWFTEAPLLFYRKDLLDRSRISSPPQTWDELKQMALQVKQEAGIEHGYVFQGAEYEDGVCNGLEYIWSHGGEMVDDYQNPTRVVIDSPETVTGLAMERSMIEDGVSPPYVAAYTELESFEEFLSGRAVFCRIVPTYYALIGGPRSPLKACFKIASLATGMATVNPTRPIGTRVIQSVYIT